MCCCPGRTCLHGDCRGVSGEFLDFKMQIDLGMPGSFCVPVELFFELLSGCLGLHGDLTVKLHNRDLEERGTGKDLQTDGGSQAWGPMWLGPAGGGRVGHVRPVSVPLPRRVGSWEVWAFEGHWAVACTG
jgi:hypothetical protein